VIPAALLFGGLRTADRYLQLSAGVPRDLVVLMQAAVVFFAGAELLGERLARRFARPPGR
jgi:ABC-type uncharacterized transport system permease subunit